MNIIDAEANALLIDLRRVPDSVVSIAEHGDRIIIERSMKRVAAIHVELALLPATSQRAMELVSELRDVMNALEFVAAKYGMRARKQTADFVNEIIGRLVSAAFTTALGAA